MSSPSYYAQPELTSDTIDFEYRNKVLIAVTTNIYVQKTPQKRQVRTKIYECTIQDVSPSAPELPAPSYFSGDNYVQLNPESLSPVGNDRNQWHCDNISYTKAPSQPMSRVLRITWVKNGSWFDYDESDSQ